MSDGLKRPPAIIGPDPRPIAQPGGLPGGALGVVMPRGGGFDLPGILAAETLIAAAD
jgi:hypothetical protein